MMNCGSFQMSRRVLLSATFLIFFTVMDLNCVRSLEFDVQETPSLPHRKLLDGGKGDCKKEYISIKQGPETPQPGGISTFTLEITNVCPTGCSISQIHLACGWFSSAKLINPNIFKRITYNDCLVNGGKPLGNGQTLSFEYANESPYSFSVSSIVCS